MTFNLFPRFSYATSMCEAAVEKVNLKHLSLSWHVVNVVSIYLARDAQAIDHREPSEYFISY